VIGPERWGEEHIEQEVYHTSSVEGWYFEVGLLVAIKQRRRHC
jgi:hypothetical protein